MNYSLAGTSVPRIKIYHRDTPGSPDARWLLLDVPATAAEGLRTVQLDVRALDSAGVLVHIDHSAGTALIITPRVSIDNGDTFAWMTSRRIQDGVGTLETYTDRLELTDTTAVLVTYPVAEVDLIELSFEITDGGADDLISVEALGILC